MDDISKGIEAEIKLLERKLYLNNARTMDGKRVVLGSKYFCKPIFSNEVLEVTIPDSEYTEIGENYVMLYLDGRHKHPSKVYFNTLYTSKADYLLKRIQEYKSTIQQNRLNLTSWENKLAELEKEYEAGFN